jgi:hypothetical protein
MDLKSSLVAHGWSWFDTLYSSHVVQFIWKTVFSDLFRNGFVSIIFYNNITSLKMYLYTDWPQYERSLADKSVIDDNPRVIVFFVFLLWPKVIATRFFQSYVLICKEFLLFIKKKLGNVIWLPVKQLFGTNQNNLK